MRRHLFLLPCALAISAISHAQQVTRISIANSGFEELVLTCDPGSSCWNASVPGWSPDWFNNGSYGTFKPGTAQFPGGVPGGVNCAYVGTSSGTGGGLFQTLNVTLQANTTYLLRMSIGHRADEDFTGYVAALLAGGVQLADDSSLNPAPGTFVEEAIVYQTGPTPKLLGQLLSISIKSVGTGQVDVDNVSLISVTTP